MLTWSILIATLSSRQDKLRRLLDVLLPQAEKTGNVEVVALHNFGERHIGEYRQALLDDARGEYVSYVDDDDAVEPDFVPLITEAMATPVSVKRMGDHAIGYPDYIAFRHQYYEDGKPGLTAFTGLQYGGWYNIYAGEQPGLYRDVTHINPVKTGIACQAVFATVPGAPDDRRYAGTIRHLARTQVSIDKVLYHYYHSTSDSVQKALLPQPRIPPPEVGSPVFRWWAAS